MAHLLKIRKGWENENLARFILSKFSFTSEPSTISDDLGANFFCTFFDKVTRERKSKKGKTIKDVFVYPKHSFAIQIKSNRRAFYITNKLEFFDNLEVPFFIGVVNQNKLSISIYSGDVMPELFSLVGLPPKKYKDGFKVSAVLNDERKKHGQKPRQEKYIIPFFKVGNISASDNEEQLSKFIKSFSDICLNYQKNIISKKKKQLVFRDAVTSELQIVYGLGSYEVFRNNLIERLLESFYNFKWAYPLLKENSEIEKLKKEINIYEKFYQNLSLLYGEIPELNVCVKELKELY